MKGCGCVCWRERGRWWLVQWDAGGVLLIWGIGMKEMRWRRSGWNSEVCFLSVHLIRPVLFVLMKAGLKVCVYVCVYVRCSSVLSDRRSAWVSYWNTTQTSTSATTRAWQLWVSESGLICVFFCWPVQVFMCAWAADPLAGGKWANRAAAWPGPARVQCRCRGRHGPDCSTCGLSKRTQNGKRPSGFIITWN